MTDEQNERLKQIRERQKWRANASRQNGRTPASNNIYADIDFLLNLVDSQVAERGYWPTLIDRGDGVVGHFCVGQLRKPGQPYWEFWNKGQWGSAGEVFIGRAAAQKQLDAMRVGDEIDLLDNDAVDKELSRWQEGIRNKLIELGAPDWKIDGAGCDSGDPLDFTLAEVGQGCGYFIDKAENTATSMRSACIEKVREMLAAWKYTDAEVIAALQSVTVQEREKQS